MRTRRSQGRIDGRNWANVPVWGVHTWSSNYVWGPEESDRKPVIGDQQEGQAFWGRGYWVTDHWLRWRTD